MEAIQKFNDWRGISVKDCTVKGYELTLRQFCLFMRNCHIEAVKLEDIVQWFNLMRELDWKNNSFIPKAMALRKMFEFFYEQKYPVLNPWLIPIPAKDYKIPRVADPENYQKLLAAIPEDTKDPRHIRNAALVRMLWDTGARNGEILSLDAKDVDLNSKRAILHTEKNKGARPFREIFWTHDTNEKLGTWMDKRDHLVQNVWEMNIPALFVSCSTAKAGERLSTKGVGEMLRQYSNKAGIPYANAHSFRHGKARRMIKEKGAPAADVMNVLGHSNISSATPYSLMWGKDLADTAQKYL